MDLAYILHLGRALVRARLMPLAGDKRGATAIEYGLIAALIAVAAITAMSGLGKKLTNTFNNVQSNLKVS